MVTLAHVGSKNFIRAEVADHVASTVLFIARVSTQTVEKSFTCSRTTGKSVSFTYGIKPLCMSPVISQEGQLGNQMTIYSAP